MSHSPTFDDLIYPTTPEEFIEQYFERQVLHVARGGDASPYDGFFDLEEMDRVIAHGELQPDYTLTLIKGDVAIHQLGQSGRQDYRGGHNIEKTSLEADNVYREVAAGNTVRVSFAERYSNAVWALAGDLERQLNANILTNVFLTPASSHAFSTHFDAHDVFILQLEGHKHWEILTPPADLPMEKPVRVRPELFEKRLPYDGRASVDAALGTEPKEYLLEAGDFLYVPRGFSHRAWSGDELSVHLTVEVRAFTWHELFAHAVAQALPEVPMLRRGLPPGFAHDPRVVDSVVAQCQDLIAAAHATLEPERLSAAIEDLANRYLYTRTPTGHQRLDEGQKDLDLDSRLAIRPGMAARLSDPGGDGPIRLVFSGDVIELPRRTRPMLESILRQRRFAVRAIETELGDTSRLTLARHLLKAGWLTFDTQTAEIETGEPSRLDANTLESSTLECRTEKPQLPGESLRSALKTAPAGVAAS